MSGSSAVRRFARLARCMSVALVLGLSWSASGARGDAVDDAQRAFQRGVDATHAGRWLDARSEFLRSLELSPRLTAHFNLAVTDLKLGLGEEALRELAAFEAQATPEQHGDLLLRVPRLRQRADALIASRPPPPTDRDGPLQVEGLGEAAAAHNLAGRHAYLQAQDELALSAFEAAYAASGRTELLFNVGLAADRLRADEKAIASYEAFAAAMPTLAQAGYARARVRALREVLAARAQLDVARELLPAVAPVDLAPVQLAPQRPAQALPSLVAPRVVTLSGAALLASVIGTALWWNDRIGEGETCARSEDCLNEGELLRQQRAAIATTITLGVAGVGMLVGGAVWLAQRKQQRRQGAPNLGGGRGVLLRF